VSSKKYQGNAVFMCEYYAEMTHDKSMQISTHYYLWPPYLPGKSLGNHWTGDWVASKADLDIISSKEHTMSNINVNNLEQDIPTDIPSYSKCF
jgi:hypothetical protein